MHSMIHDYLLERSKRPLINYRETVKQTPMLFLRRRKPDRQPLIPPLPLQAIAKTEQQLS